LEPPSSMVRAIGFPETTDSGVNERVRRRATGPTDRAV
jgi:hypothetical protein